MTTYLVLAALVLLSMFLGRALLHTVSGDGLGRRPGPRHVERDWGAADLPAHPFAG